VLNVVGKEKDIKAAIENAYKGAKKIKFEGMHYRTDIGYRELGRAANKKSRRMFCFKKGVKE